MERILNPSWFLRRLTKNDEYCTLSTSQYWDWLTYIDVSSIAFLIQTFRTITWANGKWSRWKSSTLDRHRSSLPRWLLISVLLGSSPSHWWDQSWNLLHMVGFLDSLLQWHLDVFFIRTEQTGKEVTKVSTRSWFSQLHTAHIYASHSNNISQCGGGEQAHKCITMGTTCQRCTSTTGKLPYLREPTLTQKDTELKEASF